MGKNTFSREGRKGRKEMQMNADKNRQMEPAEI